MCLVESNPLEHYKGLCLDYSQSIWESDVQTLVILTLDHVKMLSNSFCSHRLISICYCSDYEPLDSAPP